MRDLDHEPEPMDEALAVPGPPVRRQLTERETEALSWVMRGKTNWEVSVILAVSEATVKFHLRNAMAKLDATSRVQAVAVAIRCGLIGGDASDGEWKLGRHSANGR